MSSAEGDLTTKARIRNAALQVFAEHGFDRATIRQVAAAAGVSAALVIHHFGGKDALRQACDDWVFQLVDDARHDFDTGMPDLAAYLREHPEFAPMIAYVVAAFRHGGTLASTTFDRFCEATTQTLRQGVASGMFHEPADYPATAASLVAYRMGAVMLGDHLARHIGGTTLLEPDVYARYGDVALQLFTHGLFKNPNAGLAPKDPA